MNDESECILQNQIEIMGALLLLLRHAAPNLVGKGGELDRQRDDLLQRHWATERALSLPNWQPIGTKTPFAPCEERGVYDHDGDGLYFFRATHWRSLGAAK